MKAIDVRGFEGATIGARVVVEAETFEARGKFTLGDDVHLRARRIVLGDEAVIERSVRVAGIRGECESFDLGDDAFVGFSSQLLTPSFRMGDYTQLHNNALVSGYQPFHMGHNCWVGQHSILNCTEKLWLGDNVRIGTQSQLWTHVASGELLEGCTLFGSSPVTLEDNVWLVGGAVISPGLTLRRNSVIMTGAVLTRSTEPFHTYAGVPAVDITAKLDAWRVVAPDEKWRLLGSYIEEFLADRPAHRDRVRLDVDYSPRPGDGGALVFCREVSRWDDALAAAASVYDLATKTYVKRRTSLEREWMKFAVGHRARFTPRQASG